MKNRNDIVNIIIAIVVLLSYIFVAGATAKFLLKEHKDALIKEQISEDYRSR